VRISIPDDVVNAAQVSEAEMRLELAIALYRAQKVTLGQASKVAGVPQAAFLEELGRRKVPVNYGVDDLEADLTTLAGRRRR
jgi:predicted HTH domain antitoxin